MTELTGRMIIEPDRPPQRYTSAIRPHNLTMTTAMFLAVVLAGLVVSAGAQHDPRTVERKLVGNALDIDDGVSHRQLSPLVLRGLAEIVTECK